MEQHQLTDAARIGTLETTPSKLAGAILCVDLEIECFPVEAIVDTGTQCTVISRHLLHQVGRNLQSKGEDLPAVQPPSLKLSGRSGSSSQEVLITAEVSLSFCLDGRSTTALSFVQPDSDITCLIGMKVIPYLGTRILRVSGEPIGSSCAATESPKSALVHLIKGVSIQEWQCELLEARIDGTSCHP
jgi:hypothetical protein